MDAQSPTQRESSLTALADRYAPGRLEAEAVELICAHDEEPPLQAAASLQLAIAKIQRVLALKYAVCLAALLLPSCVALDSVGQISASYGGVTVSYAKPRPNVTK